jgi:soluble lytic murein transglycosylase
MIVKVFVNSFTLALFVTAFFTVGCSGQTEEQALQSLRQMTKDGKFPAESVVENFERRFPGRTSGTLARLLRARIKFENKDYAGAAALLNSPDFANKTKVGDYALWLRGQSLQNAGNYKEAIDAYDKLRRDYPDTLYINDSKLKQAEAAMSAGQLPVVPAILSDLNDDKNADALLLTAKSYEVGGDQNNAIKFNRSAYFYGGGSPAAKEAEAKLTLLGQSLAPGNFEEGRIRADRLLSAKNYVEADKAYGDLAAGFSSSLTPAVNLTRLTAAANAKKMPEAQSAFNAIPAASMEKEKAYYELVLGYAKNRLWPQARQYAEEMRLKYPTGLLTPKTWVDAGYAARDAKNKGEENYFLRAALTAYPNAVEVAGAQFELAWMEHEAKNFTRSSEMFVEHLARYADKDTTNRGKAGYWAARDSERAGKTAEACALYDGVIYRYSANWYGYLAKTRLAAISCPASRTIGPQVAKAIANLKTITVAPETSTVKELARVEKSDQLSTIGLFDWAIDELEEAKKTAQNSPKINLALARHYRFKGDNVNALLALAKSYPDYSQMFPEEMGREEWEVFYPLIAWNDIKYWAAQRKLDPYQVAGLIRQESVFNPRASSHANAYGLMQLIMPTARTVARKYGASSPSSVSDLFQPALNIELGTAYMRDQLDKYGRIEYMAVAYNAGPGRVAPWRASLPMEIDEFVEAIPFKETKGYVQGVIRNAAQYRRLYDENGNFKPNVGAKPLRGEIDSKPQDQLNAEHPEIVIDGRISE